MFKKIPGGAALFASRIGPCGLCWTSRGVDRLVVPARDEEAAAAELVRHAPNRPLLKRPPAPVRQVIGRMRRHLAGKPDPLTDVPVDLAGVSDFARRVYRTLRKVPPGKVVTYGQLAWRVGRPGGARAVGRAMATNPLPLLVPCHRVLAAGPRPGTFAWGGFSAPDGTVTKARMLFAEGFVLDGEVEAGLEHLRRIDPVVRRIIPRAGPYLPRILERDDPYQELVSTILYQQLAVKAAATIAGRVRALTPGPGYPDPRQMLRLGDRKLKGAGVSRQKLSYLRDLAAHVASGRLALGRLSRLSDEDVITELTQVRGLGRWSAQMFLMFQLGRLDVLPIDDLGLRNAAGKAYGLPAAPTPAELTEMGEKWRPYRSLGCWYMWASLDAKP